MNTDKVVKWVLPVEVDYTNQEYFLTLPEDLLETLQWVDGDMVEWVDNNDGSFTLRKVTKDGNV